MLKIDVDFNKIAQAIFFLLTCVRYNLNLAYGNS